MTTARKKSNRSRADLLPCARSGCDSKRAPGNPYCQVHKNEKALESYYRHRDENRAKMKANYAAKKDLHAERDRLRAVLLRLRKWDVLVMDKGDGEYWRREIDAALGTVVP